MKISHAQWTKQATQITHTRTLTHTISQIRTQKHHTDHTENKINAAVNNEIRCLKFHHLVSSISHHPIYINWMLGFCDSIICEREQESEQIQ